MDEAIRLAVTRLREYPEDARELLRVLRAKNEQGKRLEPWREDQLNRFLEVIVHNVRELERAFSDGDISRTAWVARNLLELSVWVRYSNLSDANGKEFRVEAARDLMGLVEAFKQLHFDAIKNHTGDLDNAGRELERVLKNEFGLSKLGAAFKHVSKAAVEIGESRFEHVNKLCSKFAHPTAWVVATVHFEEFENFAVMFLLEGQFFADVAIEAVRHFVETHYPADQILR